MILIYSVGESEYKDFYRIGLKHGLAWGALFVCVLIGTEKLNTYINQKRDKQKEYS